MGMHIDRELIVTFRERQARKQLAFVPFLIVDMLIGGIYYNGPGSQKLDL